MIGRFSLLSLIAATTYLLMPPALMAASDAQCAALQGANFGNIPEAPTSITRTTVVTAEEGRPAYCEVQGYVAPQVGFELRLPLDNWNGKFLFQGCGAMCGNFSGIAGCDEGVARGYACATTDMGHKALPYDGKWAYNNLIAERDFGFRGTHVATVAGKAITDAFYGMGPEKAYFRGCSTGGRQALVAAQRYPTDYDGIIGGAPAIYSLLGPPLQLFWGVTANLREDGSRILSVEKLPLLHNAAIEACDADDGVEDGVISQPRQCNFDPSVLECRNRPGNDCLTSEELAVVKKMYEGAKPESGLKIVANAQLPGTELGWSGYVGGGNHEFANEILRYLVFSIDPGPSYQVTDFDWNKDPQRFDLGWITAGNPDLTPFNDAGGKFILFQGLADPAIIGTGTEDYYNKVERLMGGADVAGEFIKLFEFPGMGHCAGGDGLNHADLLTALETWVEGGSAPDSIMGYHIDLPGREGPIAPPVAFDPSAADYSRPVYAYPGVAEFTGGDWKDADNYRRTVP